LALLQSGSEVMAIEKDSRLPQAVLESCGNNERLTLICSDALSPEAIAAAASFAPNKLVANLPYAVAASLVLEHLICVQAIDSVIVMVQREVAERMMAEPGRGDYGAYTVKLRLLAKPGAHFSVPRQCFSPPPRVDSTVLRLDRNPARISPELYAATAFMADAAFAQRRKTMQNSASAYFSLNGEDPSLVGGLLQAAGVPHGCRGEVLSVERFIALGEALLAAKGQWPPFQAPCVNGV
jgi:16S rRNA (adenine1518-N6/adenine1519-N6)-dimethyltransferase